MERGDTLDGALAFVHRALDKRGAVAFDRASASSRGEAVATTVGASLDLLSEGDRARVTELALFSEPDVVPLSAASALWGADLFDTEELAQRLDDVSLVEFDLKTATLRMHDVLRAHLHARIPDVVGLHRRLTSVGWPDAHTLPDRFAWQWFGWHLAKARQMDQLRELLLDYRWLAAKVGRTDVSSLIRDLDLSSEVQPLSIVRDALRLAAYQVGRDPNQLGVQLLARLDRGEWPEVDRLLDSIEQILQGAHLRLAHASLTHPGGALEAILKGHTGSVEALALAHHGARALTASSDGSLRLWDLGTWQLLRTFEGHTGPVYDVAFIPRTDHAISASEDLTLRQWDVESGRCVAVLRGHHDAVRSVAVAPDGSTAASVAEDGSVRLWDLRLGRSSQVFKGALHQLRGLAFTPDGRRLVFGAGDGTIRVVQTDTSGEVLRITGQQAVFNAVAVDSTGRRVLGGADDGSLGLWDLESGAAVAVFNGHGRSVGGVAIAPGGRWLASGAADRSVRVWSVGAPEATHSFQGHSGSVRAVVALSDSRLLSGAADGTVRCWRVDAESWRAEAAGDTGAVSWLAISADGSRVVAGFRSMLSPFSSETALVWDASRGRTAHVLKGHTKAIQSLRVTADGAVALTASRDRTLRVWDLDTGRARHELRGHWDGVVTVAMTPDGRHAVSLSADRTVRYWDLAQGRALRVLVGPDAVGAPSLRARALADDAPEALQVDDADVTIARGALLTIADDGRRAVVASGRTLVAWHLDTGRVVLTRFEGFQIDKVSIDDDVVVAASLLGAMCVVGLEDGRVTLVIETDQDSAETGRLLDLLVDASRRRAIAATLDGRIREWDLSTGREVATNDGVPGADAVAIAPNGRFAYSVSGDTVTVSDLRDRRSLGRLSLDHSIRAIAVTPDGLHAALGDEAGLIHLMRVCGA